MNRQDAKAPRTVDQQRAILAELCGDVCACGARKTKRQTFCRSHYFRLPGGLRERLYHGIPEYYDAYEEACTFLHLTPATTQQEAAS
jgi:hypothetical protein